tara:strand:+ start:203 stop:472 length:270 start_codon:yes stop_codon:yes gene_type:complete
VFKFSKIIIFTLYPFIIIYWIINVRGQQAPHIVFYFLITWQIIETILLISENKKRIINKNDKEDPGFKTWWINLIFQFILLISYYYLAK